MMKNPLENHSNSWPAWFIIFGEKLKEVGITILNEVCMYVGSGDGRIFGYPKSAEKWVEWKLNRVFLPFLPNFCHLFDGFQSSAAPSLHSISKNHQIWQEFGKKLRKALFNLPSTHLSMVLQVSKTCTISGARMFYH